MGPSLIGGGIREHKAAWRFYQEAYREGLLARARSAEEKEAAEGFSLAVRQDWLPELGRADRCRSCHIGVDDPGAPAGAPLAPHPDIAPHSFDRFGCTVCHGGDGYATRLPEAHEHLLPARLLESSCGKCHGEAGPDGPAGHDGPGVRAGHDGPGVWAGPGREVAPTLAAGGRLVEEKRCFGCHILSGTAKSEPPAPALDGLSIKVNRQWLSGWLRDPGNYLSRARMADFLLTDPEIETLTGYLLTLPVTTEKRDEFFAETAAEEEWRDSLSEDEYDALVGRGKELFGVARAA